MATLTVTIHQFRDIEYVQINPKSHLVWSACHSLLVYWDTILLIIIDFRVFHLLYRHICEVDNNIITKPSINLLKQQTFHLKE